MNSFPLPSGQASYGYLPALDGLRAVSILLVVLSHAGLEGLVPGGLGVTVFFVISGFLITRQMIAETAATGNLKIAHFYLRRVFRLFPALLLYIAVFTVALAPLGAALMPVHIFSGLFYFANYYQVFVGYPAHSPMPILWSLAVEEHYYIIFPFLIYLFRNNLRAILPVLYLALIAALAWRVALHNFCAANGGWALCGIPGHDRIFFSTDTIFDCILYGAVAALLLHYHGTVVRRVIMNIPTCALACAGLLASFLFRDPAFRDSLRFSLQSACIAMLMINIMFGRWDLPRELLSHKICIFIGKISYSLYLFHYGTLVLINAVRHYEGRGMVGPTDIALYFVLSFAFAIASYFLVEKPMLAVRRRFGSHSRPS